MVLLNLILKTSRIRKLLEKNDNIKDNKGDIDSKNMIVKRNWMPNNKNVILKSGFQTFEAKISFVQ